MDKERTPINFSSLLAFVVLIAIVLLLPVYWEWIGYAPSKPEEPETVETTEQAPPDRPIEDGTIASPEPDLEGDATVRDTAPAGGLFVATPGWAPEDITVRTPKYSLHLSTQGARVRHLVLNDYTYNDVDRKGQPIVLLDSTRQAGPRFRFFADSIDLTNAQFASDRSSLSLTGSDSATIVLSAPTRHGTEWTVAYTFYADRYDFRTQLRIPEPWNSGVEREVSYGWIGGLRPTEPDPEDDNGNFAAVALMGEDLEKIGGVDEEEPIRTLTGETHWAAVRTKYFVCAMIPDKPGSSFHVEGVQRRFTFGGESVHLKEFNSFVESEVRTGEPLTLGYRVYTGPIDYDVLKSYNVGLEEMVDLGWRWIVRPFSLLLLWLFQILHSVIPNYGIVIIVFSLVIKAVFHPLTKKQVRSMRRMQALQPKMEKLKERFKKEPQKMNQEVMKLYKDAGVNPMSGCLPLLPQMPIFYGLFQLFRTTIELRGAEFFGWVTDLSQKDPYYILPIIMTVLMFVQQKLTTKDPKQKMMMYFMPLIFGFLFRNFPAGLTLYWTCYNLFSVIEQAWLIGHPSEDEAKVNGEVGTGKIVKTQQSKK